MTLKEEIVQPSGLQILDGRYVFLNVPAREGGMSVVRKARDIVEDRLCAIKQMKLQRDDDLRWKESFNREYAALSQLSEHSSIVTMHGAGQDEQGRFYMALEWVPTNLHDWMSSKGPLRWEEFYRIIGRPILEALAYAHNRGWSHRDIKPQNILMTEEGAPKISDYGIAKRMSLPSLGITFNTFRSAPFTPPEDDDGVMSGARDCYSWAALALYCLTGKTPADYGELADALDVVAGREDVPADHLRTALSHSPNERPPLASALLADLDTFAANRIAIPSVSTVHIEFEQACLQRFMRAVDLADRRELELQVIDELHEVEVGLRSLDPKSESGPAGVRFFAVTHTFEAFLNASGGRLLIARAWPARAAEIERHREASYRASLRFTFAPPKDPRTEAANLDDLLLEVRAFEAEERDRAALSRRERVFRLWYAFLRAKADFEGKRENAVAFTGFRQRDAMVALATELPAPVEIVGQSRVIRMPSSAHVFCEVVDVTAQEVFVTVTSGDATRIPRKGLLEINTIAAEKAIERQRRAIDSVNYDRAPNPRLKTIVIDPAAARPAAPVVLPTIGGGPFDPEKREILARALGIQDVLAIQGPPGTGKTRLIEEIMVQYLAINPRHRVLLSAQTHVALDNVIERIRHRQPSIDIVRIGRMDEVKIAPTCRDLVLDRKAQAWSEQVKARAEGFMTAWAADRGIEPSDIRTGMLAERLNLLLQREEALRREATSADEVVQAYETRAEDKLSSTGSADSAELDAVSMEAQQTAATLRAALERVGSEVKQTRALLQDCGGYGAELATRRESQELADWSAMLLGTSEDQQRCRTLLELQEEWMLRVGRSSDFHAAMLASAQIVAGTCIGMAGVRGMENVVYDLCIVDEASKATSTEVLVPMSRGMRWILVGDPAQLPPFFEDASVTRLDDHDEAEVRQTLLDRFLQALPDHSKAMLSNQHRMVKPIGDLISEVFYEGKLNSPGTRPKVTLPGVLSKPVTWLSTEDMADAGEVRHGRSYRNEAECRVVRSLLERLDFLARRRKATYDISLIAGYVAQVQALEEAIRDRRHEWGGLRVTCSTVDAFQGSETEVCIYSVTRSNPEHQLGFLREKPRLNVALSRARSALAIVGDAGFCRSVEGENPFRKVLDFIEQNPDACERRRA